MKRMPLLVLSIALLLGACSTSDSDGGLPRSPDYTPRPDAELFATVAGLPGVESVAISYDDNFPEDGYAGDVRIDSDADAQTLLDSVYATLRQGRPGASIVVNAIQDNTSIIFQGLDGRAGTPVALEKRYGPQPGDGTPPPN